MSNILLADADVWLYQFAFRNQKSFKWDEDDDEVTTVVQPEIAKMDLDTFIADLRETLNGDEVHLILSDRNGNFRKELEPTYKDNRAGTVKPELWYTLREYIESGTHGYPVRSAPRLEGDDLLGIMATHPKQGPRSIVVTIDKDLQTVPCRLYLYNKPDLGVRPICYEESVRFHLLQVLMGDPVDGYKGIPGVGIKKAMAHLADVPFADLWPAVVELYERNGLFEDDAILQARLAYILQHGDYKPKGIKLWNPKRLIGVNR